MRTLEIEYKYITGSKRHDDWAIGGLLYITALGERVDEYNVYHFYHFFDKDGLLQIADDTDIAIRKKGSKHLD